MPTITLPDRTTRSFDHDTTPYEIAKDISDGLAQCAIGARIDGVLSDVHTPITADAEVKIVTARKGEKESDPDALELIRHSCAHVMAEAIQRIRPEAKLVYGPALDTGFYYDISFEGTTPLSSDEFEAIEKEMTSIIKEDRPFTRYELNVDEGMARLKEEGSKYKIDNAERAIDAGSTSLTWYVTGEHNKDWEDLCRGPHLPTTCKIGAFKL